MRELGDLRREIDGVDRELLSLFLRRMELTGQVGDYKAQKGLPVLDPDREQAVLAQKAALVDDPRRRGDVRTLFETIMALSRRDQHRRGTMEPTPSYLRYLSQKAQAAPPVASPQVVYQGVPGAYAEEAALSYFGPGGYEALGSWEDVFSALREGRADYGVVPIENSSTGSINQVYDLLGSGGAFIVGEVTLRIRHCLMARPGTGLGAVTRVYSHEQGLFQCAPYLKAHPQWETTALSNTAAAARRVAEGDEAGAAAIGSERAAALYGLEILERGIAQTEGNSTRFVVVAPRMELSPERDKVSALFTLPHRSGTLHQIIAVFAQAGLNLMKLESRPIPGKSWEYLFFVDFSGNLLDEGLEPTLRELTEHAAALQVLGNYKATAEAEV